MYDFVLNDPNSAGMNIGHGELLDRQENKCFYCQREMTPSHKSSGRTRDHIFPQSKGHRYRGNIIWACAKCNRKKSNRYPTIEEVQRAYTFYYNRFFIVRMVNGKPVLRLNSNGEHGTKTVPMPELDSGLSIDVVSTKKSHLSVKPRTGTIEIKISNRLSREEAFKLVLELKALGSIVFDKGIERSVRGTITNGAETIALRDNSGVSRLTTTRSDLAKYLNKNTLGQVAELVYAPDRESGPERVVGSSPTLATN